MADQTVIPDVEGVPPLLNNFPPAAPALLLADAVLSSEFSAAQGWGVYLGGVPVVEFKSFLGIDFRQGWAISDYPVENGAFESYDKVDLPYDARVRFASGGSAQERTALLESVHSIAETLQFYDVVTPEVVYLNCNVQHYDYRRSNTNGAGMITIELWLLEIRVVPKRGADVRFPNLASPLSDGFVQALPTIPSIFNAILPLVT